MIYMENVHNIEYVNIEVGGDLHETDNNGKANTL